METKVDGCSCTLNPHFLQGQRCLVILATSAMVHHNFEVSCLCSAGHLYHTHEKVALAVRIPAQFVRYFMPAHKKLMLILSISCIDFLSLAIPF